LNALFVIKYEHFFPRSLDSKIKKMLGIGKGAECAGRYDT